MKPFIPAWLDDLPLTPVQSRVLMHLWRRAGADGRCFPSARTIAENCRINRDTVWPVLTVLESAGLLKRDSGTGRSNHYDLVIPDKATRFEGPTPEPKQAEMEGLQVAETEGLQQAETKGLKGSPLKGTQLRHTKNSAARDGAKVVDVVSGKPTPPAKKSFPRNPLIDALASLDGSDLAQMTGVAWERSAKALAEIRRACPEVSVDEIQRRAANYRSQMPGARLTAMSLATHWASIGATSTAPVTSAFGKSGTPVGGNLFASDYQRAQWAKQIERERTPDRNYPAFTDEQN